MALTYLCELINKKESHVNSRLGTDQSTSLLCRQFLERPLINAAPCEWNKLSECNRTLNLDSFRKRFKTMLIIHQYGC